MNHDNKPLTVSQLKQMKGQMVFVHLLNRSVFSDGKDKDDFGLIGNTRVSFLYTENRLLFSRSYYFEDYKKTWIAYKKRPFKFSDFCAEWKEIATHNGCTADYDCVCSKCGASGVPNDDFCSSCGRAISEKARELLERRLENANK